MKSLLDGQISNYLANKRLDQATLYLTNSKTPHLNRRSIASLHGIWHHWGQKRIHQALRVHY